jgi:hypothetical protein
MHPDGVLGASQYHYPYAGLEHGVAETLSEDEVWLPFASINSRFRAELSVAPAP